MVWRMSVKNIALGRYSYTCNIDKARCVRLDTIIDKYYHDKEWVGYWVRNCWIWSSCWRLWCWEWWVWVACAMKIRQQTVDAGCKWMSKTGKAIASTDTKFSLTDRYHRMLQKTSHRASTWHETPLTQTVSSIRARTDPIPSPYHPTSLSSPITTFDCFLSPIHHLMMDLAYAPCPLRLRQVDLSIWPPSNLLPTLSSNVLLEDVVVTKH